MTYLVASMIAKDEMSRYITTVIPHLMSFVDEIRVVDDGSTDGTYEWLLDQGVSVKKNTGTPWAENEGEARQHLFEWTLECGPDYVLAVDSDEYLSNGERIRQAVEETPDWPVWTLLVCEVWKADGTSLWFREDGFWMTGNRSPILYKAPSVSSGEWRIPPRKLACGREPRAVVEQMLLGQAADLGVDLLHFGWVNESTRFARYQRYVEADGGEYHNNDHIESIVAASGVKLQSYEWPSSLAAYKQDVLSAVGTTLC